MDFKDHLKITKLVQRSLVFIGSLIIIITFSIFHGISGGKKTTEMNDQMLARPATLQGNFGELPRLNLIELQ